MVVISIIFIKSWVCLGCWAGGQWLFYNRGKRRDVEISKRSQLHLGKLNPCRFFYWCGGPFFDSMSSCSVRNQFDYRIPAAGLESCSVGAAANSPLVMNGLPISVYAPETVGCVAVDSEGRCAAATSTGGLMNKKTGRIGDSPLIGSGTYAGDLCGISCTGEGEAIIRGTLARDVAAVMEYKGLGLQEAVDFVVKERLDEGRAGLIAVSRDGEVACGFNTNGMFRGFATEDGFMEVGIWE